MALPHFVWCEIFFLTSIQRKKEAKSIIDQEIIFKNQTELNAPGDTWRMARLCFHRVTASEIASRHSASRTIGPRLSVTSDPGRATAATCKNGERRAVS
jgi:hypothetical protein